MARERSELILADIVATRADRKPDFPVLTFECAGKADEVLTFADLHSGDRTYKLRFGSTPESGRHVNPQRGAQAGQPEEEREIPIVEIALRDGAAWAEKSCHAYCQYE